jgi:ribosomal protein S27E
MPAIHHPRRPRASPLWQVVHHAWDDFLASYETHHRRAVGPLRPDAVAAGFARFHCPDCGHEKLLAFTCKSRHFCPACHQRRTRQQLQQQQIVNEPLGMVVGGGVSFGISVRP